MVFLLQVMLPIVSIDRQLLLLVQDVWLQSMQNTRSNTISNTESNYYGNEYHGGCYI